jgi:ubiquinone/menaquinone biosynthesis C-methylase UbiE
MTQPPGPPPFLGRVTSGHHRPAADEEPFTRSLERMNRFQEAEGRRLIADLGLPGGSRGLDVGCGVGLYTLWLAEALGPEGQVVGIEPDPERVEAAIQLVGNRLSPGRLEFRTGDGTALDHADGSFDWVWCGDVLHHIVETERALSEYRRVVRPRGRVIIKESQVLSAMFLPGHPVLERQIQLAEIARSLEEGAGRSFQERRQTTLGALHAAGFTEVDLRNQLIERRAPLAAADFAYIQKTVFERNWGTRLRDWLTAEVWARRSALCDPDSPENILRRSDYYCLYPITVFSARVPG